MAIIELIGAREILDSRGNPTVEVEVALDDGTLARAAVPSGASTGEHEAVELRDGDTTATAARACRRPSRPCSTRSGPAVIGFDAIEQRAVDQKLIDLDGTAGQVPARRQRASSVSRWRSPRPPRNPPSWSCSATSAARTRTCCRSR